MRTILRSAFIALLCGATAKGQVIPAGAEHLSWQNLDVVIVPDSAGPAMWVSLNASRSETQGFSASFVPSLVQAWAPVALELLDRPLSNGDSAIARASAALRGNSGEVVYIMRRREKGSWVKDRFLVLESVGDTVPMVIRGTQDEIKRIVRTLAAVAQRSPYDEEVAKRKTFDEPDDIPLDSPPSSKRSNRAPEYPPLARQLNWNGVVLLTFYVEADGRPNIESVQPFYASDRVFLDAVRRALPNMRFDPAVKNGQPIRLRVSMPFVFKLY
jgi:TonB family protein